MLFFWLELIVVNYICSNLINKKSESEGFERVSLEVLSGVYGKCSLMKGCHKIHIELLRTIVRQLNCKIFYLLDLNMK